MNRYVLVAISLLCFTAHLFTNEKQILDRASVYVDLRSSLEEQLNEEKGRWFNQQYSRVQHHSKDWNMPQKLNLDYLYKEKWHINPDIWKSDNLAPLAPTKDQERVRFRDEKDKKFELAAYIVELFSTFPYFVQIHFSRDISTIQLKFIMKRIFDNPKIVLEIAIPIELNKEPVRIQHFMLKWARNRALLFAYLHTKVLSAALQRYRSFLDKDFQYWNPWKIYRGFQEKNLYDLVASTNPLFRSVSAVPISLSTTQEKAALITIYPDSKILEDIEKYLSSIGDNESLVESIRSMRMALENVD